jgi:hypothetical protein
MVGVGRPRFSVNQHRGVCSPVRNLSFVIIQTEITRLMRKAEVG